MKHGEGCGLGLDFREQATSSEKKNGPPGVGGIDDKDISERGKRKEL